MKATWNYAENRPMITTSTPRPAALHDHDCRGVRWVHHAPWHRGAPVLQCCTGCTAVRKARLRWGGRR